MGEDAVECHAGPNVPTTAFQEVSLRQLGRLLPAQAQRQDRRGGRRRVIRGVPKREGGLGGSPRPVEGPPAPRAPSHPRRGWPVGGVAPGRRRERRAGDPDGTVQRMGSMNRCCPPSTAACTQILPNPPSSAGPEGLFTMRQDSMPIDYLQLGRWGCPISSAQCGWNDLCGQHHNDLKDMLMKAGRLY